MRADDVEMDVAQVARAGGAGGARDIAQHPHLAWHTNWPVGPHGDRQRRGANHPAGNPIATLRPDNLDNGGVVAQVELVGVQIRHEGDSDPVHKVARRRDGRRGSVGHRDGILGTAHTA